MFNPKELPRELVVTEITVTQQDPFGSEFQFQNTVAQCPNCGQTLVDLQQLPIAYAKRTMAQKINPLMKYCMFCGQAICWHNDIIDAAENQDEEKRP